MRDRVNRVYESVMRVRPSWLGARETRRESVMWLLREAREDLQWLERDRTWLGGECVLAQPVSQFETKLEEIQQRLLAIVEARSEPTFLSN
jgi:hypothetical protein